MSKTKYSEKNDTEEVVSSVSLKKAIPSNAIAIVIESFCDGAKCSPHASIEVLKRFNRGEIIIDNETITRFNETKSPIKIFIPYEP